MSLVLALALSASATNKNVRTSKIVGKEVVAPPLTPKFEVKPAIITQPVVKVVTAPVRPPISGTKVEWMTQAGIPESLWGCVDALVTRESGWRVTAQNPTSPAYGLPQSLPGSKMASAGADWQTNPVTQLRWMTGYVNARYGGYCQANAFQIANNWY